MCTHDLCFEQNLEKCHIVFFFILPFCSREMLQRIARRCLHNVFFLYYGKHPVRYTVILWQKKKDEKLKKGVFFSSKHLLMGKCLEPAH